MAEALARAGLPLDAVAVARSIRDHQLQSEALVRATVPNVIRRRQDHALALTTAAEALAGMIASPDDQARALAQAAQATNKTGMTGCAGRLATLACLVGSWDNSRMLRTGARPRGYSRSIPPASSEQAIANPNCRRRRQLITSEFGVYGLKRLDIGKPLSWQVPAGNVRSSS